MNRRTLLLAALALLALMPFGAGAQTKTIADATAGYRKIDGFVPLYWSDSTGKLLMEISRFDEEFLYQVSLATGVGSNPIGLDRGQPGNTHVVRFERVGPKVLLVQSNYRFRALGAGTAERRAVEESFARSVLHGFSVLAEGDGRVLVDATGFFVRDAHGVAARLRESDQGSFAVDESRSAIFPPNTKGFPLNTEIEATITLASDGPTGAYLGATVPTPAAVTVRQRHSLVRLPEPGYRPRRMDPRVGAHGVLVYDYATPIGEPLEQRWVARFRLEKKDPGAAVSDPVEPIEFFVDPGTPEPVRSALVEGASWWNAAFEVAGFRNAFRVRTLPPDADPMDVRFNVINWVHRSTRGWAYGSSIVDPRTGEIVRGVVTLDSQRARHDVLLFSGLEPAYGRDGDRCMASASPGAEALASSREELEAVALARIRQLSAHEVGHTLGLAHNFAASTYGRASVMDYPAPLAEVRGDRIDLTNAYAKGIGAYDAFAIRYVYSHLPAGADERRELDRIAREGAESGMLFLSDDDARPAGAAHPLANLWDNGPDPVAGLRREMNVRRVALANFGLSSLPEGMPLSLLEARLLPLHLHHRYHLNAAAKSIGGLSFTHAVRSGATVSPSVPEIVSPSTQRAALAAVLDTLDPGFLALPPSVVALIPPRAFGYDGGTPEYFPGRTSPVFDAVGASALAADLAVLALLEPHRAARLEEFHARDRSNPGFREIVGALVETTWNRPAPRDSYQGAIARSVQRLVVTRLVDLAGDDGAAPGVRAVATDALRALAARLRRAPTSADEAVHRRAAREDIERFLTRPDPPRPRTAPLPTPQGDPIGDASANDGRAARSREDAGVPSTRQERETKTRSDPDREWRVANSQPPRTPSTPATANRRSPQPRAWRRIDPFRD
jgi:hypothetical protein